MSVNVSYLGRVYVVTSEAEAIALCAALWGK